MSKQFQIQVFTRGEWRNRTVVEASKPNDALRSYGIRGTRPRLGEATSASGKRFRAVEIVPEVKPATKRRPKRKPAAKRQPEVRLSVQGRGRRAA